MIKKHIFTLTGQCTACSVVQVLYFFEYKSPSKRKSVTPIKATRVTSRSEPLFQSVRLRFTSTQIIRFSSGSLFAILKNTVQVWLRFDKISVKPIYKTPVRVRFDSLYKAIRNRNSHLSNRQHGAVVWSVVFTTTVIARSGAYPGGERLGRPPHR